MLAFGSERPQKRLRPNVLPCKISYNGPANAELRYWNPKTETDGTQTAYFRGRKLLGKTATVPSGYEGVVIQKTDRTIMDAPATNGLRQHDMDEEEEDEDDVANNVTAPRELKIVEQTGTFDAITVWGHESFPTNTADPYLKGVQEWVDFASAIHDDSNSPSPPNDTTSGA
ncbi:ribonuclease H1 small subunit [Myriangium duriaei CBS 260.36]|uniref:Ribonuclease H1 small subunit n=1 Tax=Myriangium duriaei CBS 260.36 TaxID=1168546 RepID=A0A9P4MJN2_9PEZI|nr:ribonuclease H1 small subunit [Myriangium duriaei CBS 260.36]